MRFLAILVLLPAAFAQQPTAPVSTLPPENGSILCTRDAYQDRAYGSTTLLLEVDKKGKAHNPRVIKPFRDDLDKKAVKSAKDWRFRADQEGKALSPGTVQVDVTFDCREQLERVGGGVTAPRPLPDNPAPRATPGIPPGEQVKFRGTTILQVIVAQDGTVGSARVVKSSGDKDVDAKGLEAVRHWRFTPAMRGGQPVAVMINVEVNFKLY